ncbi:ABC transporter permease [Yinghuangia sp. ASG 101]|uniref:ABC transporter permease n=1 Tax=Yinghuangia sp. ASG 101 TaxID=2896848 RepID=UPI001E4DD844|nr:ABC transporter permease [Yinghuangia sp. ASG 101]UGQ15069.1 ABC transporter permease [Yinghuangia sp. ASG 101]
MLSLAWSTLRARKSGFAGAFTALLCAAALITACGVLLETGLRGGIPAERYAGTPVVVTADQDLHWTKHKKGKEKTKSKPLTERAWLDAATADRLAALPGVRAVVPELTFDATVFTADGHPLKGPGDGPSWGHAWDSAVLTPFTLTAGDAPAGPDDVVLDAALAARAGAAVGDAVTVQSTAAPKTYRVTGIAAPDDRDGLARQSALFFAAPEAERLAGHPGRVAAVGLLPAPGTDTGDLARAARDALDGTTAKVRTGDARGPAEFLDAGKARVTLVSLGGALGGTSLLVAIIVVAGTFALSLNQRRRELALLRAVGATPRQIRRMVGLEAVLIGLLAGGLGAFAGLALSAWLHTRFVAVGAMPKSLELAHSPFPPLAAVLATLAAAWAAARVSARRPARVRPTEALTDAAIEPDRVGKARTLAGVLLLAGYGVLLAVLRGLHVEPAATPVMFVSVVLAVIAIALLGPLLARGGLALLSGPMRLLSPLGGRLAAGNSRTRPRDVAAVVTPLTLAIAMASTILFSQTTTAHAAEAQMAAGSRADHVVASSGPGVPGAAVDAIRAVPGVAGATEIIRTTVRAGQDKFTAQGVTTDGFADMLDLGTTSGNPADLAEGTVAVSESARRIKNVSVGDDLEVTLGDGVRVRLRVVAVYERGLGFGDLTMPHDLVAAHVDHPLAEQVLVRTGPTDAPDTVARALDAATAAYPGVRVLDRGEAEAVRKDRQGTQAQVNLVAMGLIIAFTAIAVVNTLVMATSARGREFALLRLVGMTRPQVMRMLRWETLVTLLLAVVLGTAIAWLTLSAYARGMTGTGTVYAPPLTCCVILGAAAALAVTATVLPARLLLRANAAEAIGVRE